jgi:hypothetical protein
MLVDVSRRRRRKSLPVLPKGESRLLVTEKVFGSLLAALAEQLVLNGLDAVGVIHLTDH